MILKEQILHNNSYRQFSAFAESKTERIALVCNNASLTEDGISTRVALLQNGFNLVKLFSPEHGLDATGEDGAFQQDGIDSLTGLRVVSLYGNRLAPSKEELENIELVLFDIPDIGCRFYTYLWTMTHVMEACATNNKPLIILDWPNPIGGNLLCAEGPMLDETHCASFIGRWRIPVRHSCTLGELALYFANTKMNDLKFRVIPAINWHRNQPANAAFIPTSPAIQKRATAVLYPGMGLLEGINVNEGRGTHEPFELCGAPWINKDQLHRAFLEFNNQGVTSCPVDYTPQWGMYAGEACHGIHLKVQDEKSFRPVQTGISLIRIILRLYPTKATERPYCTLANPAGSGHLDKLLGVADAFNKIKNEESIITDVAKEWSAIIHDYLIYPE